MLKYKRVNGLNAGADDYLEKPFQAQELVARLRSLLRRSSSQSETMRRRRDIEIDAAAGTVTKNGVPVELTAAVWKIEATPGQQVAEGDVLMILESMKMEIPVESPRAGRVTSVLVAEGDQVQEGQIVLLLEA